VGIFYVYKEQKPLGSLSAFLLRADVHDVITLFTFVDDRFRILGLNGGNFFRTFMVVITTPTLRWQM